VVVVVVKEFDTSFANVVWDMDVKGLRKVLNTYVIHSGYGVFN